MASSTGDPTVDQIVRERFSEAIGIARQMLSETIPDLDPQVLERLCVGLTVAVFPSLARIITEGVAAHAEGKVQDQDAEVADPASRRS